MPKSIRDLIMKSVEDHINEYELDIPDITKRFHVSWEGDDSLCNYTYSNTGPVEISNIKEILSIYDEYLAHPEIWNKVSRENFIYKKLLECKIQ